MSIKRINYFHQKFYNFYLLFLYINYLLNNNLTHTPSIPKNFESCNFIYVSCIFYEYHHKNIPIYIENIDQTQIKDNFYHHTYINYFFVI